MIFVCWACGSFRADKGIDLVGAKVICPECGHVHRFRALPLLLVGGASGSGKSTVCQGLLGDRDDIVVLDADILWQPVFDTPADGYRSFFATWLRLCINLHQSGRPVVLFGSGFAVPANIEPRVERRYFSAVHYLALTCDDVTLEARLRARPAWRGSAEPGFLAGQLAFNRWLREPPPDAAPLLTRLDTSAVPPVTSCAAVNSWITEHLRQHGHEAA